MKLARWALLAVAALALLPPLVYVVAALVLGAQAINTEFEPTPEHRGGVPIYVRTNGVHAELVLPALQPHNFTREFPRAHIIDLARIPMVGGHNWLAFGWGDRGFYLHTPTWRELQPHIAWRALTGRGPAAMHVEYVHRPEDYLGRWLWLNQDQYLDLVQAVRSSFTRDPGGAPLRIEHPGYFATDAFFEATGHYSIAMTSNEWVRRALADAGVRMPRWAPFDLALFWQLDRIAAAPAD